MAKAEQKMVTKKSWEEFRKIGLLWFVNRLLHLFGWAIVFEYTNPKGKLKSVYPARVKFRGFDNKCETDGFINVTDYLSKNIRELKKESLS